jgi:hypothetical protein
MRKYEYGTTVVYTVPSGHAGGGCVSARSRNRWNPPPHHHRLFRPQFLLAQRVRDDPEEVPLALDGPLGVFGRVVGGRAGGAAERRHLAAEPLVVVAPGAFEERIPRLVPALEPGGVGEVLVEPAARDEPVLVRGRRRVPLGAGVVRQVDEHDVRSDGGRGLHGDVLGRVRGERVPHREPRWEVRRGAGVPVQPERVAVVAV